MVRTFSKKLHNDHSSSSLVQQQALALEVAQDEIEILREQIVSYKQELSDQVETQREMKDELQQTNLELQLVHQEIQALYDFNHLGLAQAKALAKTLIIEGKETVEALASLLSEVYGQIVSAEELRIADYHYLTSCQAVTTNLIGILTT